ncbi:Asp-tRNA(Asn)/Glu-tRNA(Gln) amidotransferase subunit GatC [Candidatus Saccharibacteria bacterium]|nr:Asp-tRNA(Asn)/Glu-tRNA(Gln) amidotransferase subunit GatC [Candidatus Saccharibacteria bacterium]
MMITDEEIRHLAELSSLTMNDEELATRKSDLEKTLEHIDQICTVETDGTLPTFSVDGLETVWRKDEIKDEIIDYGVTGDDLLALRQDNINHMTKVPKVL